VADYNAVEEGKCAQAFAKLKDCYLVGTKTLLNIKVAMLELTLE
jgi:hypothetical protein